MMMSPRSRAAAFISPELRTTPHQLIFATRSNHQRVPTQSFLVPNEQVQSLEDASATTTIIISPVTCSTLSEQRDWLPTNAKILSNDPLIYILPDFLSLSDCQAALDRMQSKNKMTQSNPPQVTLERSKLWPLPFLSLGAALPTVMRAEANSLQDLLLVAAPPIALALTMSALLVLLAPPLLQRFYSNSQARTSLAMAWNQVEDMDFQRAWVDKLCEITHHPWQAWEAPVLTQYPPGAQFAMHADASSQPEEWSDLGGQRVITAIAYLTTSTDDDDSGGETYFDQLDLAVRPQAGSLLVFYPTIPGDSLQPDDRLTHESRPTSSEKVIWQLFGRQRRVPPPLGLPDEYVEL